MNGLFEPVKSVALAKTHKVVENAGMKACTSKESVISLYQIMAQPPLIAIVLKNKSCTILETTALR